MGAESDARGEFPANRPLTPADLFRTVLHQIGIGTTPLTADQERQIADIRTQGIDTIINLGDMVSGPLDARRTMDVLKALDAVHVLGNHDRYLIDRPHDKMGSWERDVYTQLDASDLDWLRAVPPTRVFRDDVFLCHATPASDEAYWLETALLPPGPWIGDRGQGLAEEEGRGDITSERKLLTNEWGAGPSPAGV